PTTSSPSIPRSTPSCTSCSGRQRRPPATPRSRRTRRPDRPSWIRSPRSTRSSRRRRPLRAEAPPAGPFVEQAVRLVVRDRPVLHTLLEQVSKRLAHDGPGLEPEVLHDLPSVERRPDGPDVLLGGQASDAQLEVVLPCRPLLRLAGVLRGAVRPH